jgi:hypothetical protein
MPNAKKRVTLVDVGKILEAEEKSTLIELLLSAAKEAKPVKEKLLSFAAMRLGPGAAIENARRLLRKTIQVRGYLGYREAEGWARQIDAAIDTVDPLLAQGHAAAVVELCEVALAALLAAILHVDDSDGHFAELRDRLEEIHYSACQRGGRTGLVLAQDLFEWELSSDFDVFFGAVERYATILGPEGLERYRELAEAEWKKVPVSTAHQSSSFRTAHYRITGIMESFARLSGDVEQLVAVMSRDLSLAYHYLKIGEVYRAAGKHDKALAWAEKGMEAFRQNTDSRLLEFAADEYHRRRLHDKAMPLIWSIFFERPLLDEYARLEKHAKKARAWPEWRERALAELKHRIGKLPRPDHSALVEIFLYEQNLDQAWNEAKSGDCSRSLWLRLADLRAESHPQDAAPIYLRLAETNLQEARNSRYEYSVELLIKAAAAMKRIDRGAEFVRHLSELAIKFKAKRNFIALLERNCNSLYFV